VLATSQARLGHFSFLYWRRTPAAYRPGVPAARIDPHISARRFVGFLAVGLYRLPIDQLVKLPLAIATEVPLGTADVILVELLVEVVGPFLLTTCRP